MSLFEPKDAILDAFLDEVMSGQNPPDNSSKILSALSANSNGSANGSSNGNGRPIPVPPPIAPPVQDEPAMVVNEKLVQVSSLNERQSRKANQWIGVAVVVCLFFVGAGIGFVALKFFGGDNEPNIVENDKPNEEVNDQPENNTDKPEQNSNDNNVKPDTNKSRIVKKDNGFNSIEPFKIPGEDQPKYDPALRKNRPDPSTDAEVVAFINDTIKAEWVKHGVQSVGQAEDDEWCRRVYVRLVGRIPTVDELKKFVDNQDEAKRTDLVDNLLASNEYIKHSATMWTNVLIGRFAGRDQREPADRKELEAFLKKSFEDNKPYDQLAFELLTATGSDGAANFMLAGAKDDAKMATAHVSRVFLGNNLSCVQCHDHYTNEVAQTKFWELNAFFRKVEIQGDSLVNNDMADNEAFYSDANGVLKAAMPVLPDGTTVLDSDDTDRRTKLANWLIDSDQLSRATVNRVWSQFFRYGFTPRVDEMAQHEASHPELLDRLSTEFVAHNYDLQKLNRWIAMSDVFGLSSKMHEDELVDAPELGGKQFLFSRYYIRPMQQEEVYNSLLAISKKKDTTKPGDFFNGLANRTPGDTVDPHIVANEPDGSFTHGPLKQELSEEHINLLGRVAKSMMSNEEKIEHLFLTALSRKPRKNELDLANKLYEANEDDTYAVLEVVWWAILSSKEFTLDH